MLLLVSSVVVLERCEVDVSDSSRGSKKIGMAGYPGHGGVGIVLAVVRGVVLGEVEARTSQHEVLQ